MKEILNLPMIDNDVDADTIGNYLKLLLLELWVKGEGFSGKRPFGNSDWQWKIYESLAKAGKIQVLYYDEEIKYIDTNKGKEIIMQCIEDLFK